jgi:S-DNA-T family DNA segregation ATPase FtsK/SpoIIIE
MSALRDLHAEMRRRTKVIRGLPRDLCPDSKVSPRLAETAALGLGPVVFGIDECQVLFTDDRVGKEAEQICTDLIKRGPATGIMLLLATQRPDAKSLPTGISANAGIRFCLRVMGQVENDIVLGTSMWRNGYRAAQFTTKDRGMGLAVGIADDPIIVRSYFLDGPAAEKVVQRAVELRGGPIEPAEREPVKAAAYDLVTDLRAVWPVDTDALWTERILPLLAALRPEVYGSWSVEQLAEALRTVGLNTGPINRALDDGSGKRSTRYGIRLHQLPADPTRAAITD